jgi:hypothetical protein
MQEKTLRIFIVGFLLTASLLSCDYKKPYEQQENCIVVDVDTVEHYGIARPEVNYRITTKNNYKIVSKQSAKIGDTISVRVIYMNGKKK